MRPGARASGLPLNLERYNLVYMGLLGSIVLGGTLYSLLHGTHSYNVLLSDLGAAAMREVRETTSSSASNEAKATLASLGRNPIPTTFLADRRNLFNRLFTKFAWFWTTAAFLAQAVTLRNQTSQTGASTNGSSAEREKAGRKGEQSSAKVDLNATVMGARSISLLRYVVATTLWIFFARWFLGPPLMERVRHYSGAVCQPIPIDPTGGKATTAMRALLPSSIEARYCYSGAHLSEEKHPDLFTSFGTANVSPGILRPRWKGGHDISGHTFILILSTLYLLEEVTPFLPWLAPASLHSTIVKVLPKTLWAPQNPFSAGPGLDAIAARNNRIVMGAIVALLTFWSVSLAVTAVYFHTPLEKLSGLLVALSASLLIPKGG